MPASNQSIKAFKQWVKDHFMISVDQTKLAFPVNTAAEMLRCVKNHKMFFARSDAITSAA